MCDNIDNNKQKKLVVLLRKQTKKIEELVLICVESAKSKRHKSMGNKVAPSSRGLADSLRSAKVWHCCSWFLILSYRVAGCLA